MAHRRVRVPRLGVRTVRDVVVLLPRPALVAPPLAALVAAALGERQPGGVGDRRAADPEGRQLDAPARALVVIGEAEAAGPERERPCRDLDRLQAGVAAGRRR